jgi:hypothetical protein
VVPVAEEVVVSETLPQVVQVILVVAIPAVAAVADHGELLHLVWS